MFEYYERWIQKLACSCALREKLDVLFSVSEMRLKMCLLCAHIYTSHGTFWKESWGVSGCRSVLEMSQSPSSRQLWRPVSWVVWVVLRCSCQKLVFDSCQIREWVLHSPSVCGAQNLSCRELMAVVSCTWKAINSPPVAQVISQYIIASQLSLLVLLTWPWMSTHAHRPQCGSYDFQYAPDSCSH